MHNSTRGCSYYFTWVFRILIYLVSNGKLMVTKTDMKLLANSWNETAFWGSFEGMKLKMQGRA